MGNGEIGLGFLYGVKFGEFLDFQMRLLLFPSFIFGLKVKSVRGVSGLWV